MTDSTGSTAPELTEGQQLTLDLLFEQGQEALTEETLLETISSLHGDKKLSRHFRDWLMGLDPEDLRSTIDDHFADEAKPDDEGEGGDVDVPPGWDDDTLDDDEDGEGEGGDTPPEPDPDKAEPTGTVPPINSDDEDGADNDEASAKTTDETIDEDDEATVTTDDDEGGDTPPDDENDRPTQNLDPIVDPDDRPAWEPGVPTGAPTRPMDVVVPPAAAAAGGGDEPPIVPPETETGGATPPEEPPTPGPSSTDGGEGGDPPDDDEDDEATATTTTTTEGGDNNDPPDDEGGDTPPDDEDSEASSGWVVPTVIGLLGLMVLVLALLAANHIWQRTPTQKVTVPPAQSETFEEWVQARSCEVGSWGEYASKSDQKPGNVRYSCTWYNTGTPVEDLCQVIAISGKLYADPGTCRYEGKDAYVLPPEIQRPTQFAGR